MGVKMKKAKAKKSKISKVKKVAKVKTKKVKISKPKKTSKIKVKKVKVKTSKSKTKKVKPVIINRMNNKEAIKFRKILLTKRDDLVSIVKSSKEHDLQDAEIGDEIDSATQNAEKEMLFELADNERVILEEIDLALRRIEKSAYGNCELCQGKIAPARLEALPWVRCCITCQQKAEKPSR